MRRISRLHAAAIAAVAVLGATSVATTALAATQTPSAKHLKLAGTWSGHYSGAFSGTFTLKWTQTGSNLSGSITLSNPHGKYSINGSVNGSAIKFGVVGAGATYKGSVSGKSMSGSYKSPQGGGTWSARKTS